MSSEAKYPECEKLRVARPEMLKMLQFLEWLQEQGLSLCTHDPKKFAQWGGLFEVTREPQEAMLLRYLGIDAKKLEDERRAILEDAQEKANGS